MKIYTKKGDKGKTALVGGERVSKHDLRIRCYGNLDELNSNIGLLVCYVDEPIKEFLISVQNNLFVIASNLIVQDEHFKMKHPKADGLILDDLEKQIDGLQSTLPPLKNFILPGGNIAASHCHITRCVCRRAERDIVQLAEATLLDNHFYLQYCNRLSDYFFVLARHLVYKSGDKEIVWNAK